MNWDVLTRLGLDIRSLLDYSGVQGRGTGYIGPQEREVTVFENCTSFHIDRTLYS